MVDPQRIGPARVALEKAVKKLLKAGYTRKDVKRLVRDELERY